MGKCEECKQSYFPRCKIVLLWPHAPSVCAYGSAWSARAKIHLIPPLPPLPLCLLAVQRSDFLRAQSVSAHLSYRTENSFDWELDVWYLCMKFGKAKMTCCCHVGSYSLCRFDGGVSSLAGERADNGVPHSSPHGQMLSPEQWPGLIPNRHPLLHAAPPLSSSASCPFLSLLQLSYAIKWPNKARRMIQKESKGAFFGTILSISLTT